LVEEVYCLSRDESFYQLHNPSGEARSSSYWLQEEARSLAKAEQHDVALVSLKRRF
jgi:hypothetical protein